MIVTNDLSEARLRRTKLVAQYQNPFERFAEQHSAGWRKAWADDCKARGEFVPFEEWFFSPDSDGVEPFEVAGGWFK